MNAYSLTYDFDKKKPLKTALLVIALGVDLLNIAFLVSAVSGDYIKFAYLAAGIAVMLALRLPTLRLTYSVKYVFKDGLCVRRIYPHKNELIFCLGGDFEILTCSDGMNADALESAEKLYLYPGNAQIFLIKTNGRTYALALDDYMLALILSFYGKTL